MAKIRNNEGVNAQNKVGTGITELCVQFVIKKIVEKMKNCCRF